MSASAHKVGYQGSYKLTDKLHSGEQSPCKASLVDEKARVVRFLRSNPGRHGCEVETAMGSEHARHLCELLALREELLCPLILVQANDSDCWITTSSFAEILEKPLSLRWTVEREHRVFSGSDI